MNKTFVKFDSWGAGAGADVDVDAGAENETETKMETRTEDGTENEVRTGDSELENSTKDGFVFFLNL